MADAATHQRNYRALLDLVTFERPHVFILGAGASRAAFPKGDRNGVLLPVMADLVNIVGLEDELDSLGVNWRTSNFETLYNQLATDPQHAEAIIRIEQQIRSFFASLRLPEEPTLYDLLVLSLRPKKDVIATFNWDPFLLDACNRNYWVADPPETLFLHGNVRVGVCMEHRTAGLLSGRCRQCQRPLSPSRLLFPSATKNYTDDPYIDAQWEKLRSALRNAYILTIFGYSAPQSDIEAVALMKEAWGDSSERNLEEIELIDIKSREELEQTWRPFLHTHHYRTYSAWEQSWVASYPRRTCEAMWAMLMENNPARPSRIFLDGSLQDVQDWIMPLVGAENLKTP